MTYKPRTAVGPSSATNNDLAVFDGTTGQKIKDGGAPATGSVTSVSVTTANGVSGSVATPTTTPAISLTLGAITPSSVAASGTVTGSNLSGTNTGNQTITLTGDVTGSGTGSFAATIAAGAVTDAKLSLTTPALGTPSALVGTNITGTASALNIGGNAATATALATPRAINTVNFDGSAPITVPSLSKRVVGVVFDGGGSPPTAGTVGYLVVPFAGTIDRWDVVANASGSAVVDVWKSAGAIPTDANRIAGTEKPTLSAAQLASDTSITTWSTLAVAVGDVLGFELESVATCTRITVGVRIIESL